MANGNATFESSTEELMKDILLSEIIAGDVRAKRSLRVFQHQEEQISELEEELSQKSNLLEELTEQHDELLQVRDYMQEVQELQRQLIKLQEVELLSQSQISDPSLRGELATACNSSPRFPQGLQNFTPELSPEDDDVRKSKGKLEVLHFPPSPSNNITSHEKGQIMQAVKEKLNILGIGSNFRNEFSDYMQSSREHKTRQNCNPANVRITTTPQVVPPKDDEDEDIKVLRKTLSSHKESIASLSREVLVLRAERDELMSYMKNFFTSGTPTETMMKDREAGTNAYAQIGRNDARVSRDRIDTDSRVRITKTTSKSGQRERAFCQDEEIQQDERVASKKGSNLEMRANRLWETACKFFTPEQAHYILTAPIPVNVDDDEDE